MPVTHLLSPSLKKRRGKFPLFLREGFRLKIPQQAGVSSDCDMVFPGIPF